MTGVTGAPRAEQAGGIDAPDFVVIDVETGKMTRLKMAPDFHRAMSEDNIDMGEYLWSPDGAQLGFVSTDRFHKNSTAKVADTNTGDVRTLFTESNLLVLEDAGRDGLAVVVLDGGQILVLKDRSPLLLELFSVEHCSSAVL